MFKKFLKSCILNPNSSYAFTLIELLVVVAIIGILSALLMSNFIGVRQRARDAQRKSDAHQIQSALELYRADQGAYPTSLYNSTCGSSLKSGSSTYMQSLPCDPSTGLVYNYVSDGTTYTLFACLENGTDGQKDSVNKSACSTTSPTTYSYTVTNP